MVGDGAAEESSPGPRCPSPRPYPNRDANGSRFIVVMGVSGTGKSTLGTALSSALRLPFIDGDDLHPAANVAKMSRGEPLDDRDRQPWLDAIRQTAIVRVRQQARTAPEDRSPEMASACGGGVEGPSPMGSVDLGADGAWRPGVVVACSSLKRAYRAVLRGGSLEDADGLRTYFVYLEGDRDVLTARMRDRTGHFMKAGMLESQLSTLESPEGESGVVTVSVGMSTTEQVQRVVEMLRTEWR